MTVVMLLVVVRDTAIFAEAARLQRKVDAPGQLRGDCCDGLLCSDASAECPTECAELALGPEQRLGCQTQRRRGAIGRPPASRAQHPVTGLLRTGSETQPRHVMPVGREP